LEAFSWRLASVVSRLLAAWNEANSNYISTMCIVQAYVQHNI